AGEMVSEHLGVLFTWQLTVEEPLEICAVDHGDGHGCHFLGAAAWAALSGVSAEENRRASPLRLRSTSPSTCAIHGSLLSSVMWPPCVTNTRSQGESGIIPRR